MLDWLLLDLRDPWNWQKIPDGIRRVNPMRQIAWLVVLMAGLIAFFFWFDNKMPVPIPYQSEIDADVAHQMRLKADHRAEFERGRCGR